MQCVFKIIICTVCCYCSKFTLQITLFSLFTWFKQITLLSLFTWFKRTRNSAFDNIFSFKTDKLLFLNISITKYDNEFIFTRRLVMKVLDFTCNDPKCHDHVTLSGHKNLISRPCSSIGLEFDLYFHLSG